MPNRTVTMPGIKYFQDRLLFFIDCKYFTAKPLTDEETKLVDTSIMRAAVELKAYDYGIDMMKKEGYEVIIEERKFCPDDLISKLQSETTEEEQEKPIEEKDDSGSDREITDIN